nr:MAG: hypothetical protein DIU61_18650 [Bacteroidota bacterium]
MKLISISKVKPNPDNPRIIKDDRFEKLVKSLKEFPEMSEVRPLVVNKDMVVLGGNMRLRAMKEAGWKEVPVEIVDWPEEKQREFIIKDNIGYGEWDFEVLANEWDQVELEEWGLDIPNILDDEPEEAQPDDNKAWFLNIACDNEQHCQKLYERFINEGLNVKIVT